MPALDHLVYATGDLERTVASIAELTGVEPVVGGQHPGMGTLNYLLGLGHGAYLEIIGPDPAQTVPPQWFGIAGLTEPRLVNWAVRTEDIGALVARTRAAGYDPGDPQAMSRRATDGTLITWTLTPPPAGILPFLIDWGTTAHPTERGLPEVSLVSFTATHPDPDAVREELAALGVELEVTRPGHPCLTAVLEGRHGPVTLSAAPPSELQESSSP